MLSKTTRWGATPEEWLHFSCDLTGLGLFADLVPIVCDPTAEISPKSKLRGLGKAPSVFNRQGKVTGIVGWEEGEATYDQINGWMKETRYGFGLRTGRGWIAIDADFDIHRIIGLIQDVIGARYDRVPVRYRGGSPRRVFLFRCSEPVGKRIARKSAANPEEGGGIELLGLGQQFVAAGVHPSGNRYRWGALSCGVVSGEAGDGSENILPDDAPSLSAGELDELWTAICEAIGATSTTGRGPSMLVRGPHVECEDPRLNFLFGQGLLFDMPPGPKGQFYLPCPFKDQHTEPDADNPSECCYFPKGSGGVMEGHYHCFHTYCETQGDSAFDVALGYVEDIAADFQELPTEAEGKAVSAKPAGVVVNGDGTIPATISNLTYALETPRWIGIQIALDDFLGEVMFCPLGSGAWRELTDDDRAQLRLSLERCGFKPIKREDLRDAIRVVARDNRFDSAQDWLNGLAWDGEERVERFLIDHFGTEDTPYTRAVSRYWWSAHAARVLVPGCQADMVPVLVSPEGRYKSTTLQALVPSLEYFTEIDLATKDAELSRQMLGKLLGELGELKGLNKRETADLKAKITSPFEDYRPLYNNSYIRFMRRIVFVGTTNDDTFMAPAIGKRRWLPVTVAGADPLKLAEVREQLWAEGREIVSARIASNARGEVEWEEAYRLAPGEREAFEVEDAWTTGVDHWLDQDEEKPDSFTTHTVFTAIFSAFDRVTQNPTPNEQSRMAEILKSRGFKQVRKSIHGRKRRVWTTAGPEPEVVSGHS